MDGATEVFMAAGCWFMWGNCLCLTDGSLLFKDRLHSHNHPQSQLIPALLISHLLFSLKSRALERGSAFTVFLFCFCLKAKAAAEAVLRRWFLGL